MKTCSKNPCLDLESDIAGNIKHVDRIETTGLNVQAISNEGQTNLHSHSITVNTLKIDPDPNVDSSVVFTLNNIFNIWSSGDEVYSPLYLVESFPFNMQMSLRFDNKKELIILIIFTLKDNATYHSDGFHKWPMEFHTTGRIQQIQRSKIKYPKFFVVKSHEIIDKSDFLQKNSYVVKPLMCFSTTHYQDLVAKSFIVDDSLNFKWDVNFTDQRKSIFDSKGEHSFFKFKFIL